MQLGELDIPSETRNPPILLHDLTSVSSDWNEHRSIAFAGDLISAAIVSGDFAAAREAAQFIASLPRAVSPILRKMAMRTLGNDIVPSGMALETFALDRFQKSMQSEEISAARKQLADYPSNAILWMDLAFLYAIRGHSSKAERAARIALNLAPNNRFVLRAAARFFVHIDRPDVALDVIRKARGLTRDPWLVAAEVAISIAAERIPQSVGTGLSLINSDHFHTRDVSELSSAIGTLEFRAGSLKKAKKLFKTSLISPNDNSLAQATWISREINGLRVNITGANFQIARPFEAKTYRAFVDAEWMDAFGFALQWINDQPFSSRPVHMASYIAACIFENFAESERITKFGLVANPSDPGCFISLAFCYANTNRTKEAAEELAKIKPSDIEGWVDAAVDANFGLIAFREGRVQEGRRRYAESVRKAKLLPERNTEVSALTNWALEEIVLKDSQSARLLDDAAKLMTKESSADLKVLLKRLSERIASRKK